MKSSTKIPKTGNRGESMEKVTRRANLLSMVVIFFMVLLPGSIFSQAGVFAGEDWSVCEGDVLVLSDLNPSMTGISGDAWWETEGDGTFLPSILYGSALTYVPGNGDVNAGEVVLTLYGREYNPNGPIHSDQVTIYFPDFIFLACNDHINFSLDKNCQFHVEVDMLLEGEHPPLNLYFVKIWDENGHLVPGNNLTGEHVGQIMDYAIGNECDLNTCEGTISVKDKYPPILYCENDTITCLDAIHPDSLGFPLDTALIDTMYYIGNNKYYLVGWDACTDATLRYQDQLFEYTCDSAFQELIVRTWWAEDLHGNKSTGKDSIFVRRVTIEDLILPPSYNNIDSAALDCNGDWIALPNGNPSPESTGFPLTERCHDIVFQYTDTRFEGCGNTFDVFRNWTIMDWCTQELVHHGQIIKVMDNTPPEMNCTVDTLLVGADLYNCYSKTQQLYIPQVTDDCSDFSFQLEVYLFGNPTQKAPVTFLNGKYYVSQLPMGIHRVQLTAIDECGNESECTYFLKVEDDVQPYAVCDEHTQVSLSSSGIARLYATSLDDGSFDNCGIKSFEVIKMTDVCDFGYDEVWGPYVDFCCDEVGDTIQVTMRVTDLSGNTNTCMVEVLVEDKLPPAIVCLPDITVSCDFYYNPDDLDSYFGKMVTSEEEVEDIIIYDYFNNGVVGQDGVAYDNCYVEFETTEEFDLNECNVGTIYRTFTAIDAGGLKRPCLQRIFIEDPDPFDGEEDIVWPSDVLISGCLELDADTSQTGSPIVDDDACSLVAISFEDQYFSIVDDACEKIVRTWTVIDWCQFDHNTLEGQWTYKQVIKLYNTVDPVFTSDCGDREVCIYGYCDGLVELTATAEDDCTPEEDLVWKWKLDRGANGSFDDFGSGNSFGKILQEGVYAIHWTVEDKCGNQSFCSYEFTVKDCKLPTPYCISSLTTAVMNNNGMVSVKPEDFDIGSYDNCTATEDLLFSWSPDVNDKLYTITCDSMGGFPEKTFYLDMWVTDEAGNQDYCSVWLKVQDNFDFCGFGSGSGLVVGGNVYLAGTNQGISGTQVDLDCSLTEYSGYTNSDASGSFHFNALPQGYDYTVEPVSSGNDCSSGVSTLDMVFIQRHILGLGLLDSPYKMLAADANNTNSISAADILEIRKVVLGINTSFPGGKCWKYVKKNHVFSNPNIPWNYPGNYQFTDMTASQMHSDFYAVKVGDVNTSYSQIANSGDLDNRSISYLSITDEKLIPHMITDIPVYLNQAGSFMGIQFTLAVEGDLRIRKVKEGSLAIGPEHYAIHENGSKLTLSWNDTYDRRINENEPIFYLELVSGGGSSLSDGLILSDDITESLLFSDFREYQLGMRFTGNQDGVMDYALYQNEPNPFDRTTRIAFDLPEEQSITLTVYNVAGKPVYQRKERAGAGRNEWIVGNGELVQTGVYYYTLSCDAFTQTRKMLLIK